MTRSIEDLAQIYGPQEKYLWIIERELQQRIDIISQWNIQPGSKILDIGCGQGDSTVVLANQVGEEGHVTGIDPAPLDYGDPCNLGQIHANLKSSPLGPRITFHQATVEEFLESNPDTQYDYAIFMHCIWYFNSPEELLPMLSSLRARAKTLLIADWSMDMRGDRTTLPHLLAAISQGEESTRTAGVNQNSNIQTLHTPKSIKNTASEAGWQLENETYVDNPPEVLDGRREAHTVLSEEYAKKIASEPDGIKRRFAEALVDTVRAAVDSLGPGEKVGTMSSWLGFFS